MVVDVFTAMQVDNVFLKLVSGMMSFRLLKIHGVIPVKYVVKTFQRQQKMYESTFVIAA